MIHREEREFVLRLALSSEFPDDYDGDDDGYAWAEEIPVLAGELLRAALQVLARHPRWRARPGNRGRSSTDEVTLLVERVVEMPNASS
jgi:hypothetical protein